VHSQPPLIAVADRSEAVAFLAANPQIAFFELIFTNMSGVPRGKRLRRHELLPVYDSGRYLPFSPARIASIPGWSGRKATATAAPARSPPASYARPGSATTSPR
jgi:glutamine synthetase